MFISIPTQQVENTAAKLVLLVLQLHTFMDKTNLKLWSHHCGTQQLNEAVTVDL